MSMIRRVVAAVAVVALAVAGCAGLAAAIPPQAQTTAAAVPLPTAAQVLLVGDSITGGGGTLTPSTDAWSVRWRDRMCGQDQACRDRILVSAGHGACLMAACNGQPSVRDVWVSLLDTPPRPTTVVVEIGVNDLFNPGVTIYQYAAAYQYLMTEASSRGVRVLLATIPPTTTSWPFHVAHNPLRMQTNSWLRGYFGSSNIWDIDAALRIGSGGDADPIYYYGLCISSAQCDGLHPTSFGALRLADWLGPERIQ